MQSQKNTRTMNGIGPAGSIGIRARLNIQSVAPFKASDTLERFIAYFAPMVDAREEAPQDYAQLARMAMDAGLFADLVNLRDIRGPLRLQRLAAIARYQTQPFIVWSGGSESTIYSSPRINHAFRALHDAYHLIIGADFTDEGEREVCAALTSDLAYFVPHSDLEVLHAETVGQLEFKETRGYFPDDQARFVSAYLDDKAYAVSLPF